MVGALGKLAVYSGSQIWLVSPLRITILNTISGARFSAVSVSPGGEARCVRLQLRCPARGPAGTALASTFDLRLASNLHELAARGRSAYICIIINIIRII